MEGQLPLGLRGVGPTNTEMSLVGRPMVMFPGISSSVPWVFEGFGMKSIGVAVCTSSIAASVSTTSSWMVPPIGNACTTNTPLATTMTSPVKNRFISLMTVMYLEVVAPTAMMNIAARPMAKMVSRVLTRLRSRFRRHILVIRILPRLLSLDRG